MEAPNSTTLFIPVVNVLQEKSLDRRFSISVDFQNNDLYTVQELTRCAALLNFISGKQCVGTNVNNVFDSYIRIDDPIAVFVENFEQFFAMYIHSKYGQNSFKLYMKTCEKSNVAYPINVFEAGMCIFMQYNPQELRRYVYSIITMFYYYTGQDFYEMIQPSLNRTPRPNAFDEFGDEMTNDINTPRQFTYEQKLCRLNKRNYNINKPIMQQTPLNTMPTNRFEKCLLMGLRNHQYDEVMGGINQRPVVELDLERRQQDIKAKVKNCNPLTGVSQDAKIFQLSEHLKRSQNFESNTISGEGDDIDTKYNRKTHVQTNFSSIWKSDNRRQLVALSIVNSVMDVCLKKITYSLIEENKPCEEKLFSEWLDNRAQAKLIKPKKVTVEVSFHQSKTTKTCRNDKL